MSTQQVKNSIFEFESSVLNVLQVVTSLVIMILYNTAISFYGPTMCVIHDLECRNFSMFLHIRVSQKKATARILQ